MEHKARAGAWRGLLDVGCGDGSVLAALGVRPAVGLDWSREAARAVAERGFAAVCGELENTPFKASTFSVVTMFHYLEHVSPARPSLDAARRLLAPDGRLVVQVPNRDCWQRALLRSRWAGYDAPRHLIHYSTSTLRDTLERHGYDVLRVTHAAIRDNPATFANSLAPRLYPPGREARVRQSGSARRFAAAFAYLGVVAAAVPFALLESLSGCGASVMMEARPRNAEH
jgi:SAM-dependent methyltransferase